MKFRLAITALATALSSHAFAQLVVPIPGIARYADGSVHRITGISGALIAQPDSIGTATAVAFSDAAGLWASADQIQLLDRSRKTIASYPAGDPSPLLGITAGPETAVVWLPASKTLLTWRANGFLATEIDASCLPGKVTSVSFASPRKVRLLVQGSGGVVSAVLVSASDGSVYSVDVLPGVSGPAFMLGAHIVSVSDHQVAIDGQNGSRRTIPLKGITPLAGFFAEQMSDRWLHLASRAESRHWALFLTNQEASLSEIPGIAKGSRQ